MNGKTLKIRKLMKRSFICLLLIFFQNRYRYLHIALNPKDFIKELVNDAITKLSR